MTAKVIHCAADAFVAKRLVTQVQGGYEDQSAVVLYCVNGFVLYLLFRQHALNHSKGCLI